MDLSLYESTLYRSMTLRSSCTAIRRQVSPHLLASKTGQYGMQCSILLHAMTMSTPFLTVNNLYDSPAASQGRR